MGLFQYQSYYLPTKKHQCNCENHRTIKIATKGLVSLLYIQLFDVYDAHSCHSNRQLIISVMIILPLIIYYSNQDFCSLHHKVYEVRIISNLRGGSEFPRCVGIWIYLQLFRACTDDLCRFSRFCRKYVNFKMAKICILHVHEV